MKTLPIYQIDAFTDILFGGNPAAVVPLDRFLPGALMQTIAAENNLSETAFVAPRSDGSFDLRWFTPASEIEFCGHATVAAAHTLIQELGHDAPLTFHTQIGVLTVAQSGAGYTLRAPNYPMTPLPVTDTLKAAFGPALITAYAARNNIYIEFNTAEDVHSFIPDMGLIAGVLKAQTKAHGPADMGASIMAIGDGRFAKYDFVSRHFAPLHGVPEDPVTGSAHSALGPFYADKLGKTKLSACQCSVRSGRSLVRGFRRRRAHHRQSDNLYARRDMGRCLGDNWPPQRTSETTRPPLRMPKEHKNYCGECSVFQICIRACAASISAFGIRFLAISRFFAPPLSPPCAARENQKYASA